MSSKSPQPTLKICLLILLSAALSLGLVFPSLSSAEIYKYVDEEGVVHLANVPTDKYNFVLKSECFDHKSRETAAQRGERNEDRQGRGFRGGI
jgi:hypothetical protein